MSLVLLIVALGVIQLLLRPLGRLDRSYLLGWFDRYDKALGRLLGESRLGGRRCRDSKAGLLLTLAGPLGC